MASQQVRVNKPIRDSFRSGIPVSLLYWNTQFYLNLKMLLNEISYSEYLCKDMHTDFILLPYLFFDSKLVCPIVLFSLYVHYLSYFCSISCTIFFTPCAISVYASSLFSYRLIAVPSSGNAKNFPNGVSFHMQSLTIAGIILHSPRSALSIASFISVS